MQTVVLIAGFVIICIIVLWIFSNTVLYKGARTANCIENNSNAYGDSVGYNNYTGLSGEGENNQMVNCQHTSGGDGMISNGSGDSQGNDPLVERGFEWPGQ